MFHELFSDWKPGLESFLFFCPHDDDAAISLGMTIVEARNAGVPVTLAVVSDGRNGYVRAKDRAGIVKKRRNETVESCRILGVPEENIHFLDFPDCSLSSFIGRRRAQKGEPADKQGFTGLENHFVTELRRKLQIGRKLVAPTRIFVPSPADYHQDHVAVARSVPISIFHAMGGIWPECGEVPERMPYLYWHCVYCALPDERVPNIRIEASPDVFDKKIKSVEAYNSQGQIASLIKNLKENTRVEYLLEEEFRLYKPGMYDRFFYP